MKRDELISKLDVWQEHRDPCENGHVEHGPEAHLGQKLVHTFAGPPGIALGADWDYDDAVGFIKDAKRIAKEPRMGHVAVDSGTRIVSFAVVRETPE